MSYYFAAAIAIAAIVGHGSARVAALSAADEARIEQMLWDQQTQLYEAGRHDGGPYESDIAVLVKNPFGDSRDLLSIGGFVESDTCWLHLSTSDLDASKAVTGEEYVGFCKLLVPDILSDAVTTFQDLPPVYRDAFEATACLCQNPLAGGNPDDVNCCSRDDENDNSNPGDGNSIRIPVQPSNSPNATEINYLYTVCSLAEAAAERYINSAAPTTSPDVVGTTESPVGAPNVSPPISSPTTSGVTEAPSMEATPFPTVSPTDSKATSIAPSPIDVLAPTATPSVVPSTSAPATSSLGSSLPSLAPVTGGAPTQDPAEILTTSAAPVGFPVPSVPFSPTSAPVGFPVPSVPSIPSPTQDPADISTPTTAPIVQGPSVPTVAPSTVEATVSYDISLRDGQEQIKSNVFVTEYLSNLIVAMDTLAIETAEALERRLLQQTDQGFRSRNLRRSSSFVRLLSSSVEVTLPTSNEVIDDILCPLVSNVALPNSTVCQRIDALIRLNVLNGTSETAESNFVAGVRRAIVNGQLQSQLDSLAWETVDGGNPVMVLTGLDLSPSPVPSQDGSRDDFESENNPLSAAQIFGISLAGLVLALVPVSVFLMQRRRGSGDDAEVFNEDKKVFREIEAEDAEEDISSSKPDVSDVNKSDAGEATPTLGASQAYYGKGGHEAGMLLDDDDDDDDGAASSNAGSSGWSSSAGISSLNTGSVDDAVDIAAAAGATLAGLGVAGLGVASGYSRNLRNKVETPRYVSLAMSNVVS